MAEPVFEAYRKVQLVEPLAKKLKLKKAKMEEALKAYEVAADYGVADVTTAATYRIATVYRDFGKALMTSERPKKLSKLELEQYNVLLEEQADPFEEKAIELHERQRAPHHAGRLRRVGQEQLRRAARAAAGALRQDRTQRGESSMRSAERPPLALLALAAGALLAGCGSIGCAMPGSSAPAASAPAPAASAAASAPQRRAPASPTARSPRPPARSRRPRNAPSTTRWR